MRNKTITLLELSKILSNPVFIDLFEIKNISYFEIKLSKLIPDRYEIRVSDTSNNESGLWITQIKNFTYEELKYFIGNDDI